MRHSRWVHYSPPGGRDCTDAGVRREDYWENVEVTFNVEYPHPDDGGGPDDGGPVVTFGTWSRCHVDGFRYRWRSEGGVRVRQETHTAYTGLNRHHPAREERS